MIGNCRYSTEEEAAEAHDVAALKCHGLKAKTNFHISRCESPFVSQEHGWVGGRHPLGSVHVRSPPPPSLSEGDSPTQASPPHLHLLCFIVWVKNVR